MCGGRLGEARRQAHRTDAWKLLLSSFRRSNWSPLLLSLLFWLCVSHNWNIYRGTPEGAQKTSGAPPTPDAIHDESLMVDQDLLLLPMPFLMNQKWCWELPLLSMTSLTPCKMHWESIDIINFWKFLIGSFRCVHGASG